MILINFSHPITATQLEAVEGMATQKIDKVIEVKTQFDHAKPFVEQMAGLLQGIELDANEWQTLPVLVNLPALSVIAGMVLAELHRRMGYFPPILRLKPANTLPPSFEVAEILNLRG